MNDVYIISDLHIGGVYGADGGGRGFRINTQVPKLTEFVKTLTTKSGNQRELIIDGDMVDFLAEQGDGTAPWVPFTQDPVEAVKKLDSICSRDSDFFQALGGFLAAGHKLTILLGNHDIELALPAVRARLAQILGVKPGYDYELITNGEAIIRGDALIEHGNRYDMFNVVDYDALRRVSSLQSRRQPVPPQYNVTAPAGSHMVAQVINPIKEHYRFIDLLKPETGAVVPVLLAVEPGYRSVLANVARIAVKAREHRLAAAALPGFGGDISSDIATPLPGMTLEQEIGSDISAMPAFIDRAIGMVSLLLAANSDNWTSRIPALQKALLDLNQDKTADEGVETEQAYLDAATELTKGGFKYVVFGHTHARKKIALEGGGVYFNSGCWVDLMRVPPDVFSTDHTVAAEKIREFVGAVETSTLTSWVTFLPTFVRFAVDGDRVASADLYTYSGPSSV